MVTNEGILKICDLSLSALYDLNKQIQSSEEYQVNQCRMKIKPGRNYKSPEVLNIDSFSDHSDGNHLKFDELSADLWSLGCVIAEMMDGQVLFKVISINIFFLIISFNLNQI